MKDPHQDEMIGRKCCGSERRMGIKTHMLEIMASLSPPDKRFNYRHLTSVLGTLTQAWPQDGVKENLHRFLNDPQAQSTYSS
jgi:hypothetical protein